MQTIGVLGRIHQFQDTVGVDALGERELDDVAGAGRVLVQLADDRLDLLLGGGLRQFPLDRGDADLGAVAVLAVDVPAASRIVAHQEGAQTGLYALGLQCLDAGGELGLDSGCGGLAIQDLGSHTPIFPDEGGHVPIRACGASMAGIDHCTCTTVSNLDWTE